MPSSFFKKSAAVLTAASVITASVPASSSAQGPDPAALGAALALVLLSGSLGAGGSMGDGLTPDGGDPVPQPPSTTTQQPKPTTTTPQPLRTTYLQDLTRIDGNFYDKSLNIDGTTYSRSLSGNYWASQASTQYDLGKKYKRFLTTIGVSDDSQDTSVVFRYQVYVDDVIKYDQTTKFGQPKQINLDVSGGVRLRIVVTRETRGNSYPVMGDPRLLW